MLLLILCQTGLDWRLNSGVPIQLCVQEDEAQSHYSEVQIRIRLPRYTPSTGAGQYHQCVAAFSMHAALSVLAPHTCLNIIRLDTASAARSEALLHLHSSGSFFGNLARDLNSMESS